MVTIFTYILVCLIPGWTVCGLFPSPPTTTSARPTSCRLKKESILTRSDHFDDRNDVGQEWQRDNVWKAEKQKRKAFSQSDKDDKQGVDNDKYWPGMAERLYSTLWQLSVLVGKLLDPKSGAEPRSPDHNYHYLSKPIVWSFKKKIFKIQKRKWLLISKCTWFSFHRLLR